MGSTNPTILKEELRDFAQLLGIWSSRATRRRGDDAPEGSYELNGGPGPALHQVTAEFDKFAVRERQHVELDKRAGGLILGPKVTEMSSPAHPVLGVTLRWNGDHVDTCLRVVLLRRHGAEGISAFGWRFESADREPSAERRNFHPYPHAQAINGWRPGAGRGFKLGYGAVADLAYDAETKPAFPLRGDNSPASLAVNMIATLYGEKQLSTLLGQGPNIVLGRRILERIDGALQMRT